MATPSTPKTSSTPILLGTVVAYAAALGGAFNLNAIGTPLAFSPQGILNVGSTVAPLFAIAAFVERAVEVVITATRDQGMLRLQRRLSAAGDAEAATAAQHRIDAYKLETQRISFAVALAISVFAGLVGMRAIAPLLASPPADRRWFDLFDVTLTSLLLAGGSEGIHRLVTTITTFLETSKTRSEARAIEAAKDLPPRE